MKNYILADIYRLRRRVPRIILIILVYIVTIFGINFARDKMTWNSVAFISSFEMAFSVAGLFICLFEFLFVYASDFKARIMQAAIGRGLKREQVVLAKFIEVAIMDSVSLAILLGLMLIYGLATGITLGATQLFEISVAFVMSIVSELIITGIIAIFLFLLQNAGLAAMFYAILFWDPIKYIFGMLSEKIKIIVTLHLQDMCFSNICERFQSHLVLGQFDFPAFIGIIIYLLFGYFMTVAVFNQRELEF